MFLSMSLHVQEKTSNQLKLKSNTMDMKCECTEQIWLTYANTACIAFERIKHESFNESQFEENKKKKLQNIQILLKLSSEV